MIIVRSPLRISIAGGGTDIPSYYKINESFYINYAKSWRSKVGKKAKKYQLLTNEHLSAKYRVNGSLMRSDLFLNTFKIKQKDKMYYENKENIW